MSASSGTGSQMGNTSSSSEAGVIEIRLQTVAQLFDSLDPFPFRERDLDRNAEDYIVGWAQELPRDKPLRIVVHLPRAESETSGARTLPEALHRYFAYRVEALSRELKEMFRVGRLSLAIGLAVLAVGLIVTRLVAGFVIEGPWERFVTESIVIVSWVANWKPIQIFLYDWWPLARRRSLYRRLAVAEVDLEPA
jgi:hypothetical protein